MAREIQFPDNKFTGLGVAKFLWTKFNPLDFWVFAVDRIDSPRKNQYNPNIY